jgi:aspartate aminotransferase
MGQYLDLVPFSGIIRIRDMMYSVKDPFRLDQGDVSFDVPDTMKEAMQEAISQNRTHYLQTTGVPQLLELVWDKLRLKNRIPVSGPDEIMVTNGGIHALYLVCQAILEPGDEVIVPDPTWPPASGQVLAARAVSVPCPLHEAHGWRYDLDELRSKIGPRTRAIYLNSPHNPTGGVLTRSDLEAIADMAVDHDLWLFSDEAYEDVVYEAEHVSVASMPGLYERTIPFFTFSKSYAATGLRLGYVAIRNPKIRERARKLLFYTTSNVASIVQYGGIGALAGSQASVDVFRRELHRRRDLFFDGIEELGDGVFSGRRPAGTFYAFLKINPALKDAPVLAGSASDSLSWRMAERLIRGARVGCVPGVDFGANGEGYIRFCFARDPGELSGALDSMRALFRVAAA